MTDSDLTDDGLPNLEGLAQGGNPDDLLLGIELRLAEGPGARERQELMLRAARLCARDLDAPERARGWLERFRAPAAQVAIGDERFRALCREVGAEELLQLPVVGDQASVVAAPMPEIVASGPVTIALPTWAPFWRVSLVNGAVITMICGGVGLLLFLSNTDADSSGVPWWLLVFFALGLLATVGYAYRTFLWPASQRVLELGADDLVIRDGQGTELHREPRDRLRPDAGRRTTLSGHLPVVQLVGVGIEPIAMTCHHEAARPIRNTSNDLTSPKYVLDRETWNQLVRALDLEDWNT